MNFIAWKAKKPEVLKFELISDGMQRVRNAPNPSLKFVKDKICITKMYQNYIPLTKNSNFLANLKTLKSAKNFMKISIPEKTYLNLL